MSRGQIMGVIPPAVAVSTLILAVAIHTAVRARLLVAVVNTQALAVVAVIQVAGAVDQAPDPTGAVVAAMVAAKVTAGNTPD